MKKIFIIFVLLIFGSSVFASCALTGGACSIEDIMLKNKPEVKEKSVEVKSSTKILKPTEKPVKKPLFAKNKLLQKQKSDR